MTYNPRTNLRCLALQLGVELGGLPWPDAQIAVRAELLDDGSCRLAPLYPADVPAWVESVWEAELPTPYLWSTSP